MKIRENYTCPLEIVHDFVKGKWKTILIFQLRHGTKTFSELKHGIQGISEKMLIQQLKELQEFGIINKTCYEGYPLHVEYFLTARGTKLLEAVLIMQDVGVDYMIEHGHKVKMKCKENVVGALLRDSGDILYSVSKKSEYIQLNPIVHL